MQIDCGADRSWLVGSVEWSSGALWQQKRHGLLVLKLNHMVAAPIELYLSSQPPGNLVEERIWMEYGWRLTSFVEYHHV
jgi:hypothetical protein